MASGDTKTEALLDILGNGGDPTPYVGCCNTKTQNYIIDAIDRINNVEQEVEEIKNNPDVADIVATYAELQSYDTSKLTDKDVIRVLADETHDGDSTYYRYSTSTGTFTYIGESKQYTNFVGTDGTSAGAAGLVPAPATTDAGKYLKADGTWDTVSAGHTYTAGDGIDISVQDVISATNTGKARVLTTADYNWPTTGTKTAVALWLLPSGMYVGPADSQISVKLSSSVNKVMGRSFPSFVIVKHSENEQNSNRGMVIYIDGANPKSDSWMTYQVAESGGADGGGAVFTYIVDNLNSTSSASALSAKQGKVLKDKFGGMQLVKISQTDYDNLATKDPDTLYVITGA